MLSDKDRRCPPVHCFRNHFLFLTLLEEAKPWDVLAGLTHSRSGQEAWLNQQIHEGSEV